jgi:hypothetical protein
MSLPTEICRKRQRPQLLLSGLGRFEIPTMDRARRLYRHNIFRSGFAMCIRDGATQ